MGQAIMYSFEEQNFWLTEFVRVCHVFGVSLQQLVSRQDQDPSRLVKIFFQQ